ncbi:MAG: methyltransferase, partial [Bradyrhizobium sp.]
GLFVLGDVVQPHLAAPAAALALLRFGAASGFFWAAAFGLMRIFVSDYLRLKKTVGLSYYAEAAMLEKLKGAGFAAERALHNIGHNQRRMTFLTRPA